MNFLVGMFIITVLIIVYLTVRVIKQKSIIQQLFDLNDEMVENYKQQTILLKDQIDMTNLYINLYNEQMGIKQEQAIYAEVNSGIGTRKPETTGQVIQIKPT